MSRARPIEDWRDHRPALALMTGDALAPLADVVLSELVPEQNGFRLRSIMTAHSRCRPFPGLSRV